MLSKRANDIVFFVIVGIVVIGVVIARFMVLGVFDERIEEVESDIQSLEREISSGRNLIADYRHDVLPSESVLYRNVPQKYVSDQLIFFLFAQLQLEGIEDTAARNISLSVQENPSFPGGTEFSALANTFDAYRIQIRFNTHDVEEAEAIAERLQSVDQLFVLQSVDYELPRGDSSTRVNMHFVTFYKP